MATKKELLASALSALGPKAEVSVEKIGDEWEVMANDVDAELIVTSYHRSKRVAMDNVLMTLERIAIR